MPPADGAPDPSGPPTVLSSPDRDDDLLCERLRALHDVWPGDPADDDPLRAARRATGITAADGTPVPRARSLLRSSCRALLARLGASATGLPLPPAPPPATGARQAVDDPPDPR
ncbi:hypothetical protein ACMA46_02545 [Clavibacter sp. Sh2141]